MKIAVKVLGAIVIIVLVVLVTLSITGFGPIGNTPGPHNYPGLWLKGKLVDTPVTDWSFTDNYQTIKIQTNTWYGIPHSVTTYCVTYNGQLYLTSIYPKGVEYPHGRSWNEDVARNPHVRLKIGSDLYQGTLVRVTDPALKAAVMQNKHQKYPKQVIPATSTIEMFRVING